jgi:hypothetical protein
LIGSSHGVGAGEPLTASQAHSSPVIAWQPITVEQSEQSDTNDIGGTLRTGGLPSPARQSKLYAPKWHPCISRELGEGLELSLSWSGPPAADHYVLWVEAQNHEVKCPSSLFVTRCEKPGITRFAFAL